MNLRPYQEQAVALTLEALERGKNPLVVMATGLGKTALTGFLLRERGIFPVLFVAHRRELLTQAQATFRRLGLTAEIARHLTDAQVTLTSIQTLHRRPDAFRGAAWATVDEGHHVARHNTTYRTLLDLDIPLLGLTATPNRADGAPLTDFFDVVSYRYTLEEAIRDGWLTPPTLRQYDMRLHTREEATEELARVVAKLPKPCIVYTSTIKEAEQLAPVLNAPVVHGKLPLSKREQLNDAFKGERVSVVLNCQIWTEGFDSPSVRSIVVYRNIMSELLLTQIIGRGLRLYPGKETCEVVEFVTASYATGAALFGCPRYLGELRVPDDLRLRDILQVVGMPLEEFDCTSWTETRLRLRPYAELDDRIQGTLPWETRGRRIVLPFVLGDALVEDSPLGLTLTLRLPWQTAQYHHDGYA